MSLTGRYKFVPTWGNKLIVHVEDDKLRWRQARKSDIPLLEPEVADGRRFREERYGVLTHEGKRYQ